MKIKRISSRQWTYPTKPNQHSRRCWFSSPAHSSNEIIPEVLTAHGDRDEMVRGTADAAAKLSFKSDFGRSDIKAAISALCCDCGGRLDKWNVNKWLLQRVRWIPNKPAGRICCEGTRGHWDPPETPRRHTVAALTGGEAGTFYRESLLNSELSSSCSSSNLLSLPHMKSYLQETRLFSEPCERRLLTLWFLLSSYYVFISVFYFNSSVFIQTAEAVISLSEHDSHSIYYGFI